MGTIDDHKEVAALMLADRLDAHITVSAAFKYLTVYRSWSEADAKEIIARAKQIHERRKENGLV